MSTNSQILDEIHAFCRARGVAETTFGQRAVHEWTLVERLKSGRTITLETADRVRRYIAENSSGKSPRGRRAKQVA